MRTVALALVTFAVAAGGAYAAAVQVVGEPARHDVVDCAAPPRARLAAPDRTPRPARMVYDATYLHMEVEGLDAWVGQVAAGPGRAQARFVARCPAALETSDAVAGTVPAAARDALAAARGYAREMWNEREMTRLLPAVVRRSRVAGQGGWTLALVGPRPRDWRYAVVDDDGHVVAWQLKGSDAQRLFGTGSGAAS